MTATATRPIAREVPARSWRVMIVEDNRAVAALHRRIVDSTAYLKTAHVALNGDHAFAALDTVQPDLVILDLTMSGGDGISFLRRLRATELAIDVIVVTASRDRRAVDQVTRLGVVDYLVKPFTPAAPAAVAVRVRNPAAHPEHALEAVPGGRRRRPRVRRAAPRPPAAEGPQGGDAAGRAGSARRQRQGAERGRRRRAGRRCARDRAPLPRVPGAHGNRRREP